MLLKENVNVTQIYYITSNAITKIEGHNWNKELNACGNYEYYSGWITFIMKKVNRPKQYPRRSMHINR